MSAEIRDTSPVIPKGWDTLKAIAAQMRRSERHAQRILDEMRADGRAERRRVRMGTHGYGFAYRMTGKK